jgi:ribonuclease-3
MPDPLSELEKRLGVCFEDRNLLIRALTHRSSCFEGEDTSNERMEFMGDSILGAIVAEHLYQSFTEWSEGELTRAKAALVSSPTLAAAARRLELGELLLLSKGEEQSGGRNRSSILCGAFEAVIAAIYLEAGMEATRSFISCWLAEPMEAVNRGSYTRDYKTMLQEITQEAYRSLPAYRVIEETGPDHDKTFVVGVTLGGEELGIGRGKSKKEAEQSAARLALEKRADNHT